MVQNFVGEGVAFYTRVVGRQIIGSGAVTGARGSIGRGNSIRRALSATQAVPAV
jgi:hypothetical protein